MFLFSDGFDHYMPIESSASAMAGYLQQAGYAVNNANNTTFAVVQGMDADSKGLQLSVNQGSATPPSLSRSITTTATRVVFGFAFRGSTGRTRIVRIDGIADVDWDSETGRIKIGELLGTNVIILNAWWYIEVVIDKVTNKLSVYANDTLQLEVDLPGSVGNTFTITWGMTTVSPVTTVMTIDDFYILDNSPGQNTDRLGPIAIVTRAPTVDVDQDWNIVGSENPNHFAVAAQLDPGAPGAPYLQANVDGHRDTFMSGTVLPNNNEIYAVSVVAYARKGDLDDRSVGLLVKTQGGELELQRELTEEYLYHQTVFEQAPGSVEWNQNRVETSEFGIVAR